MKKPLKVAKGISQPKNRIFPQPFHPQTYLYFETKLIKQVVSGEDYLES